MKNYAPENASFLFPFQFDVDLMREDLEKCLQYNFMPHFVHENYDGDNYILPLRSIGGRLDMPFAAPDQTDQYRDTPVMEQCQYLKKVVNTFLCKKDAVRLMNLPPGGLMKTHVDYNLGYEDGVFRVHVPIITNDEVYFILNGKRIIMEAGKACYANVNLPHSVENKGTASRVHLVLDCIRNEWSDDVFDAMGYNFELEKEIEEEYPVEVVREMIRELELQNTPASREMAGKFRKQYAL
jgi:hypothetical protein